jgi:superfamily II DNA or RNA helicase
VKQALPLRGYQKEALASLNGKERELIVLPTGGGKTVVFSHGSLEFLKEHKGSRVIVVVHTDELVNQAYEKIKAVAPKLDVGIVKGSRKDIRADVIVASVQTLRNPKVHSAITCVGLLIIDEAHHALAASYITVMKHFGSFDGRCQTVGFTATPMRGDGKTLFPTWERVAFQRDISWMVRKRYLVPPKGKAVRVPDLDLRKVKMSGKDYREGELGEALSESLAPELVAQAWMEHAKERKTLGFAPTVASAEVFAQAFTDLGIESAVIHGGLPLEQRKAILRAHRTGFIRVLWNCMILTEGYDDPSVSCIIVARPTKSKGLYIQIVGRGLRVDEELPYEGQDCLVLDVVGAAGIHTDLRSIADLSERKITEDQAHSGTSLVDLEDLLDAGEGVEPDAPEFYAGPVEVHDFDPLGNTTTKVWLKTKAGTFFVPAGTDAYVFICQYPEPGQWSVCWAGKNAGNTFTEDVDGIPRPGAGRNVGMTAHRGLSLEAAMVWAEDLAVDMGVNLNTARKSAPWRKKPASEKLVNFATRLGIKLSPIVDDLSGMPMGVKEKAGEVSDRVTIVLGSQRLDPLVKLVQERSK